MLQHHENAVGTIENGERVLHAEVPLPLAAVLLAFTLITHGIPGEANLIASGVTSTNFSDFDQLEWGTTYLYIVRAVDESNGSEDENLMRTSGTPLGPSGECTTVSACAESASPQASQVKESSLSRSQTARSSASVRRSCPSGCGSRPRRHS